MKEEFKYVVDNSTYIKLDEAKIDNFINDLGEIKFTHWAKDFNLDLTEKEWILLASIIESMNFCFWKKPKWKIEYNGEIISGSNALFYTMIKHVENDKNFLNIDYLSSLTEEEFNNLFIGIEGVCPYLDKRYINFKETISYIKNHDFYNELFSIKSGEELLNYVVSNFNSFNDKSIYKGKTIHFYKRANLLVNDLYYLSETIRNNVGNVDNLSGCADYGIPRTFRDYGIMIYNEELANMVDNEIEIPHDSEMEIEIRANILYIIEIIKERLNSKGIKVNSVNLDNIIWNMGKKMSNRSNSHHTVTIYYRTIIKKTSSSFFV